MKRDCDQPVSWMPGLDIRAAKNEGIFSKTTGNKGFPAGKSDDFWDESEAQAMLRMDVNWAI